MHVYVCVLWCVQLLACFQSSIYLIFTLLLQILRNAINKTYNRITDLRKEILSLEKSTALAEGATVKAQKELESAEAKLEVVDGQPVHAENSGRLKRLKGYATKAKEEEISLRESLEAKEALLARAFEENKVTL